MRSPSTAFLESLRFVLRWEGGFVDHPADPGGRTNKGVTQSTYDGWRARQGLAGRDVRLIEDAEIESIYETDYWVPPRCDLLRRRLDRVHFDSAVNTGPRRAVSFLQAVLGCRADGIFGPRTARAVAECDVASTVEAYCDSRLAYYRRLVEHKPDLRVFLKGWTNRVSALRAPAGLRGGEPEAPADLGDAGYVARVPDLGIDPSYDFEVR